MSEMMKDGAMERPTGAISDSLREYLHHRQEICAELEGLPDRADVADYGAEVSRLCTAFSEAPAVPPEFAELLDRRFRDAMDRAKEGEARFRARCAEKAKLQAELDALLAAGELATLPEAESLERRWNTLMGTTAPGDEFLTRLEPLKQRLAAEAEELRQRCETAASLTAELNTLTAAEDIEGLREKKGEIEKAYAALGNLPRNVSNSYQEAHRKASLRLAQHYETLDLARWESYTLKLDICAKLETLNAVPENELGKAARTLNELREKWKTLGSVPKEKNDEVNPRYLELTRSLQVRIDEYFAARRKAQKASAAEKLQLCEKAEEASCSTEWNVTSELFRTMQQQWKQLPRAGAEENALFARFRAAADKFFSARKAYWDERDKLHAAAAEAKKALIAEALALTDIRRAKQMREAYRAIGSAGRADAALYQEFNAALGKFFDGKHDEWAEKERKAEALAAELHSLAEDPLAGLPRAREIRQELQQLGVRSTRAAEKKAVDAFGTALNGARARQQQQQLVAVRDAALLLAAAYDRFRNGEAPELPAEEMFLPFAKLRNARHLLEQAASGDEKAKEKLEKQISAARCDREKICSELEKLTGACAAPAPAAPADSLAAELEAAILGNFAKAEARSLSRPADPRELQGEFLNSGLLPQAELEALFDRFDRACAALKLD